MHVDAPILVVDDDPAILRVISEALELCNYAVETASNGVEALAVLDRVQPCLVLLDLRMPILDGWGFMQEVAARGLDIQILIMTAEYSPSRWAANRNLPPLLRKPFDLDELIEAVERQLAARAR
jgi:CheY-like chemotaxis protein